jgi:hypothetical protein
MLNAWLSGSVSIANRQKAVYFVVVLHFTKVLPQQKFSILLKVYHAKFQVPTLSGFSATSTSKV